MGIALEGIQQDHYRLGDYQVFKYDRNDPLFGDEYLVRLYHLCRESKRRSGDGILSAIFAGNPPSNLDSIVTYLHQHPPIVFGEWQGEQFVESGFAFPVIACGTPDTQRSLFAGYGIFRHAWGKPETKIMVMLGLAFLFQELNLVALHGTRYAENILTERFMSQFGFQRIGVIPQYQLKDGKLVDGVVTTLLREDFERVLETFLVEQYRAEMAAEAPVVEVEAPEPVKEDLPPLTLF